jgi:hypothetical protein
MPGKFRAQLLPGRVFDKPVLTESLAFAAGAAVMDFDWCHPREIPISIKAIVCQTKAASSK